MRSVYGMHLSCPISNKFANVTQNDGDRNPNKTKNESNQDAEKNNYEDNNVFIDDDDDDS